ncbi:MAG: arsenate reductase ArsC [Flavobacteriales bacterium]
MKKKVLVLCTGNSCRSQMAEGWLRHFHSDKIEVYSAGLEAHGINPFMKKVMEGQKINIDSHTSNMMSEYEHLVFDYVITLCDHANDNCPYFKDTKNRLHHSFEDPANAKGNDLEKYKVYNKVCNQIKQYCLDLEF